jgi:HAD superfamily hydrolase (TIGR01509 family)
MSPIAGALLDVDGTLLNSNDAHAEAWVETFAEYGIHRSFSEVRPLIGMGADQLLPRLTGVEADSDFGHAIAERRSKLFLKSYLPKLAPCRGARSLLERMRRHGLVLTVATSASEQELEQLLRQAGVEDLIEEATSSDDAESSKPAPDIVEAAIRRSGLRPEELLMLGDTPYDISASRRAGVATVAVRCGGFTDEELAGAIAIYDDPAALLADYDRSPFSDGGERSPARAAERLG